MNKITSKEKELLFQISEYQLLSINQIMLLTGKGKREVQRKIENLRNKDFITFLNMKKSDIKGRTEYISFVSDTGATILQNEIEEQVHTATDRIVFKNFHIANHQMLLNWFRIHLNYIPIKLPDLTTDFISSTTPFLPLKNCGLPLISEHFESEQTRIDFIPDGVFYIKSEKQNKSILFFLEVDMGTEPLTTKSSRTNTITTKIKNYRAYFQSEKYKRYQKKWNTLFNGFRLLFLTNSLERKTSICELVSSDKSNKFIWATDQNDLFENGLGGKIWSRGCKLHTPKESILGPTLNFEERLFPL